MKILHLFLLCSLISSTFAFLYVNRYSPLEEKAMTIAAQLYLPEADREKAIFRMCMTQFSEKGEGECDFTAAMAMLRLHVQQKEFKEKYGANGELALRDYYSYVMTPAYFRLETSRRMEVQKEAEDYLEAAYGPPKKMI